MPRSEVYQAAFRRSRITSRRKPTEIAAMALNELRAAQDETRFHTASTRSGRSEKLKAAVRIESVHSLASLKAMPQNLALLTSGWEYCFTLRAPLRMPAVVFAHRDVFQSRTSVRHGLSYSSVLRLIRSNNSCQLSPGTLRSIHHSITVHWAWMATLDASLPRTLAKASFSTVS